MCLFIYTDVEVIYSIHTHARGGGVLLLVWWGGEAGGVGVSDGVSLNVFCYRICSLIECVLL